MAEQKLIPANFQQHRDGRRFQVRAYNGGKYEVYSRDLDHVCECLRKDVADMVADSLEAVSCAGIRNPEVIPELVGAVEGVVEFPEVWCNDPTGEVRDMCWKDCLNDLRMALTQLQGG